VHSPAKFHQIVNSSSAVYLKMPEVIDTPYTFIDIIYLLIKVHKTCTVSVKISATSLFT